MTMSSQNNTALPTVSNSDRFTFTFIQFTQFLVVADGLLVLVSFSVAIYTVRKLDVNPLKPTVAIWVQL